jgi:hypothetical protein
MFQGRNQKSISFQGLSDGTRSEKKKKKNPPNWGCWEQSYQHLLRSNLFYLFITCRGRKQKKTKQDIGVSKASKTFPYMRNVCEEYKNSLTRDSLDYQ